jgi:hypothetical protein
MSDFYRYFKENMEGLGLPAPESLYGTLQAAVANAAVLLGQIDKFGQKVTVRELIVAGTRLEKLAVIGALSAAFYVGAVIGSIAIATGRVLGEGTSLADVMLLAQQRNLNRPWLRATLVRWPGTYKNVAGRRMYCVTAAQR